MISFTIDKWKPYEKLDELSLYVQEIGGHFEVQRRAIEFYVPDEYQSILLLKYPELELVPYIY